MDSIQYCYISNEYYNIHDKLVKILDIDDDNKHELRTHLCLNINYNNNNILIPLRKNLGKPERKFGRIGFAVPSESKPLAGLDYRYIMIINNNDYLKFDKPLIPLSQTNKIEDFYDTIEKEAIEYIESFIKVARKNRVDKTSRFKESSLVNFYTELDIVVNEKSIN